MEKIDAYIKENLHDLAAEILDWKETGRLHGGKDGKMRVLAKIFRDTSVCNDTLQSLNIAEMMACEEALRYIIK